ncbi:MAG: hypothetical protein ABJP48_05910 [Erythrobacter sp.]
MNGFEGRKNMMKCINLTLGAAALVFAVPSAAQSEDGPSERGPGEEQLQQIGEAFASLITAEPLTPEQEARLPAAEALMMQMLPNGFYAEIMEEAFASTLEPTMALMSGETGAELMLSSRFDGDEDLIASLSPDEKVELAQLLDPGFAERGGLMQGIMVELMSDIAAQMEPGFRAGMAKAYAVRFSADQLADIGVFFATPTGEIFALENMRLMTDPQVMSASMQALPSLMQQFGDIESQIAAAMDELPDERRVEELTAEERNRAAQLLGLSDAQLDEVILPPSQNASLLF